MKKNIIFLCILMVIIVPTIFSSYLSEKPNTLIKSYNVACDLPDPF